MLSRQKLSPNGNTTLQSHPLQYNRHNQPKQYVRVPNPFTSSAMTHLLLQAASCNLQTMQ